MYKTRFQTWGIKKYGVHKTTKFTNLEVRRRHARARETDVLRGRRTPNPTELQQSLQKLDHDEHLKPSITGHANPVHAFSSLTLSPIHLDIPSSSSNSSQHTARSSVSHTPGRSQDTSPRSGSDRVSLMTPESSGSSDGNLISQLSPSGSDTASTIRPVWPGGRSDLETFASRPRRAPEIPRSVPQSCIQVAHSDDHNLEGQVVDQVMGYSSPSTFTNPTPNETLQRLMTTPLVGSLALRQVNALRQEFDNKQVLGLNLNLESPQPETWMSLCFLINVYLVQEQTSTARHAMQYASMVYQRLVQERNDQILSILNLVLTVLFLHRQKELAAELLSEARTAASKYLEYDDPIMVSIEFMIAMALKKPKRCGIPIPRLRQVADQMRTVWGEDHRYCITADYHLAWRLSMESESELRSEALSILRQTQFRSEHVFDPLHMQTVALITTKARVLGHLGYHVKAEQTMSEAVRRIERWNIAEDYPYYIEAKRRQKIFSEELARTRSR